MAGASPPLNRRVLPLPLGEGWGEGLRRPLIPHPRPFSQREKGEKKKKSVLATRSPYESVASSDEYRGALF